MLIFFFFEMSGWLSEIWACLKASTQWYMRSTLKPTTCRSHCNPASHTLCQRGTPAHQSSVYTSTRRQSWPYRDRNLFFHDASLFQGSV